MKATVAEIKRTVVTWLAAAVVLATGATASAATLVVANTSDSGEGSLRQAILNNLAMGGGNTITFSNTVTGTITLTSGELLINTNVTITGPGQAVLSLNGNNVCRVFHMISGNVALSGLTITRGKTNNASGGGILQEAGTLMMSACTVVSNVGGTLSGGMESRAQARLADCTIASNTGTNGGVGGIFQSSGSLSVSNCTLFGNSGVFGGGVWVSNAALQMINCTLTANNSGFGGGLFFEQGSAGITNSTFYKNSATHGGGIYDSVAATVRNTIVASNSVTGLGPDCFGTVSSAGFNLIGRTNGSSGWTATDQLGNTGLPLDPLLGPLEDNGGFTLTIAPLSGSPAVDRGNSSGISTDQRGRLRPYDDPAIANGLGNGSDIGAVELSPTTLLVTNLNDNGPGSLRQALAIASPVDDDFITFAPNLAGTITLTSGELVVDRTLTIVGPGPKTLSVSGNNSSRVFDVIGGQPKISGLTIRNGRVAPTVAASEQNGVDGRGGGIYNQGSLALSNCIVVSNSVFGAQGGPTSTGVAGNGGHGLGGAIYSAGSLTAIDCGISNNQCTGGVGGSAGSGFAGGAGNGLGGAVCIIGTGIGPGLSRCTLDSNLAAGGTGGSSTGGGSDGNGGQGYGGALYNDSGPSYVFYTSFSSNRAVAGTGGGGIGSGYGGGIYNVQFLQLFSCTVASNNATGSGFDFGGGIYDNGTLLYLRNSTVAGNHANYGGGMFESTGASLGSTILAANTVTAGVGPDGSGNFNSADYNLVQNTNGMTFGPAAHDLIGANPALGVLQDNGGNTLTMALLAGSAAIDKGINFGLTVDQRGRKRPFDFPGIANAAGGDACDIGAFEVNPPILNIAAAGTNVILSWSTNDAGYTLESKTTLNPLTSWSALGTGVVAGAQFTVTNGAGSSSKIYRLRNP